VLVLEVDSLSRRNAARFFNQTRRALAALGSQPGAAGAELTRSACVGKSSIPNQLPLLAGCLAGGPVPDGRQQPWSAAHRLMQRDPRWSAPDAHAPNEAVAWCPQGSEWLHMAARRAGYATFLGHEFCSRGSPWVVSSFLPEGALRREVDHFHDDLFCFRKGTELAVTPCVGRVPRASLGLTQIARMWAGYASDRPKLAWLNMAAVHEMKYGQPDPWRFRATCERLDRTLSKWLLRHVPAMRDTLLIVRGDHGIAGLIGSEWRGPHPWSAPEETHNGFLHVLLQAGTGRQPSASSMSEQLRANRQALVTALDLHKTIRGAMGLPSPSLPFARDVLREAVSPMRSCREARVPPPLCDGFWQDFI